MADFNPITPADILPDGIDTTTLNGKPVRKGTVAAFLANIEILEAATSSENQKIAALEMLKELAPAVIAVGLTKHVQFKNPVIQHLLENN